MVQYKISEYENLQMWHLLWSSRKGSDDGRASAFLLVYFVRWLHVWILFSVIFKYVYICQNFLNNLTWILISLLSRLNKINQNAEWMEWPEWNGRSGYNLLN